jgi:hypothetical protein
MKHGKRNHRRNHELNSGVHGWAALTVVGALNVAAYFVRDKRTACRLSSRQINLRSAGMERYLIDNFTSQVNCSLYLTLGTKFQLYILILT